MSDLALVLVALGLLLVNAFFVGAEFALISARRTNIEPRARAGSRAARITLRAMENVSLMMAGAQLGITMASLGLGSIGEPAVAHLIERPFEAAGMSPGLLHPVAFVIAMIIVVFLHVVIGEMVPKNVALAGPDRAALILTPVLVLVVRVLYPLLWVLNRGANLVLRVFRVTPQDEVTSAYTRDEVAGLVEQSRAEGLLDLGEERLLVSALSFEERTAAAVLLPISTVVTVPVGATPAQVEQAADRSGFSRFPVQGPGGDLLGYLHLKDMLVTDPVSYNAVSTADLVRELPVVGQADRLRVVLATMQGTRAHLARVTDDQGATLGILALEDVLAELVGVSASGADRVAGPDVMDGPAGVAAAKVVVGSDAVAGVVA